MQNWITTLNYAQDGVDYEQTYTAPFLPQKGDMVMAIFKNENTLTNICFKVDYITFSNLTFSIRINLKK